MKKHQINTFIFDIGNVLIKCGAIYLLRNWMGLSSKKVDDVLKTALHPDWVGELDLGKPFEIALQERILLYPQYEDYLLSYGNHWDKTMSTVEHSTVKTVRKLIQNNYKVYALSNWPSEKYSLLEESLPVLKDFESVIISGDIGLKKPEQDIFRYMINKYRIIPSNALFIDDLTDNINTAKNLGFNTLQYTNTDSLNNYLEDLDIL